MIPAEYRWQAFVAAIVLALIFAQLVIDAIHGWPA